MSYKYSVQAEENQARAVGIALPVSMKQTREVCNWVRGKPVSRVKKMLSAVIAGKLAVPFTRYKHNVGHRHGMAAGRFPGKAAGFVLSIVSSAEANAQFKGLSGDLIIQHAGAQVGPTMVRGGRRRKEGKRVHVEVVLRAAAKKAEPRREQKKAAPAPEAKAA